MVGLVSVLSAIRRCVRARHGARPGRQLGALTLATALGVAAWHGPAAAQAVRGEASITINGGYGRLLIRMASEVEAQARLSGGVLVIEFKRPVDIAVDRIAANARGYIGAARRDPDGRALRFALARKVRLSTMTAGERLFVDLLPDEWAGEPPSLPHEVVEELSRRARDAERSARQRVAAEQLQKIPPVRVRVATQPTFTRYIFELPELTGVAADRAKDKLTLSFTSTLRFDLADAKLAQPEAVNAVEASSNGGDGTLVRFDFGRAVDVRTFREDTNFVVDVSPVGGGQPARAAAISLPPAGVSAPTTVPAKPELEAKDAAAPAALSDVAPDDAPMPPQIAPAKEACRARPRAAARYQPRRERRAAASGR